MLAYLVVLLPHLVVNLILWISVYKAHTSPFKSVLTFFREFLLLKMFLKTISCVLLLVVQVLFFQRIKISNVLCKSLWLTVELIKYINKIQCLHTTPFLDQSCFIEARIISWRRYEGATQCADDVTPSASLPGVGGSDQGRIWNESDGSQKSPVWSGSGRRVPLLGQIRKFHPLP